MYYTYWTCLLNIHTQKSNEIMIVSIHKVKQYELHEQEQAYLLGYVFTKMGLTVFAMSLVAAKVLLVHEDYMTLT